MPLVRFAALFGPLVLAAVLTGCGSPGEQVVGSSVEDTGLQEKGGPTYLEDLPGDVLEDFVGTEWTLVSLYGNAPLDGTNITLNINEDRVEGTTGCNYYGSSEVTMGGGDLKIGGNNSTKVGCGEAIQRQEEAYLRALNVAATYRVQDGRLEIQDATGATILVYAAKEQRDMDPADLVGTAWRLDAMNGVPAPEGSEATLYFSAEGRIRGYGACGSYSGSYEAEGDDLAIIGLGMEERVQCGPEDARTQTAGLGMGSYDYALGEARLEFFGEGGGELVFVPLPEVEKADLEDRLSKEGEPRPEPPGLRSR